MGWAKQNLSAEVRRSIAESLFRVTASNKDWVNGYCPLHEENNPSFGYNVAEDVFHCHAACHRDGDLVDLYCLINGLDMQAGFVEFKKKFGDNFDPGKLPQKKGKPVEAKKAAAPVDYTQLQQAYDQFTALPESWIKRLWEKRRWTKEAIQALGIRKQTRYRDKHTGVLKNVSEDYARIAIPIHDQDGVLRNIRLYAPEKAENKIISWGAGYGENRLWPWPKPGSGLAWICEGEPDTVCARSLGLEAYTQTAKRKRWPEDQIMAFKDRDVVICYDADLPGDNYARAAADCLAPVASSVRIIVWPGCMRDKDGNYAEKHGQDLTDFIVRHGKTRVDLENLLADAIEVRAEDTDKAWMFFGETMSGRIAFQPRLLAERLLNDVELLDDPLSGLLYRWNGQVYEKYEVNNLKRRAIKYLGTESVQSRYEDAVKQAVLLSTIPSGRSVNDHHNLLCLKNGMFDIDTFKLYPHDKQYLSTIQINVAFDPERPPPCKRWQRFLEETVQTREVIEQLQEFYGLCLTRETRYETSLFAIGDGGDGKSTAQSVLRAMVGAENTTSISFDALEDQFQRAMLYNKLVNMSSEVGGKAMDSEYFKKIVSGDEISASFKHKDGFDFKPFCKLVFALNKMPKVTDTTDGLYRRILPVQFKRQYLPGDPARDPHLVEKLLEELPGIFGWSLVGLQRLRKRGAFNLEVEETQQLLTEYRRQNMPVFTFVQDCCIVGGEGVKVSRDDLYRAYRTWCGKNGFGAVHSQNFFGDVRRAVKAQKKLLKETRPRIDGTPTRSFEGIGLLDSVPLDPA